MDTVKDHPHKFASESWPFQSPENVVAFTTSAVVHENRPVLLAFHDQDGEWQFLHGPVGEADKPIIVCLGCAYQRDNTIGLLAGIPPKTMASRASIEMPWEIEPYEPTPDDG